MPDIDQFLTALILFAASERLRLRGDVLRSINLECGKNDLVVSFLIGDLLRANKETDAKARRRVPGRKDAKSSKGKKRWKIQKRV